MVNDDDAISRRVYVQLDGVRSELDRSDKSRNRVLRQGLMCTAVRDLFRDPLPVRPNQKPLGYVVLGTMSAKL